MNGDSYAFTALAKECSKIAGTLSSRNQQLNASAFSLGQLVGAGILDRSIAEHDLLGAAAACGYVAKDGAAAARSTIKSGLDRGERHPRRGIPARERPICPPRAEAAPAILPAANTTPTARFLWGARESLDGRYLRQARGLKGPFPTTLGFLPARGEHPPAMIAAFGVATEPEPAVLAIDDREVMAIHLTKLRADGLQKASVLPNKIMVGSPKGSPIVVAPPNDLLGMCITEGIEDALSAHEATGLGAWAAGSASLMPALADTVPGYIEHVSIWAHRDPAGTKGANELARNLRARGIICAVAFLDWEAAA